MIDLTVRPPERPELIAAARNRRCARWIYVTRNRFGRRRELVLVLLREDEERATRWWYEHMPGGDGSAGG
ncbi:MAG TPA: hypothetical protein VK919_07565 [Solirubrobacterales bacterium]|nr:hypothetical protein [Solirubrobacterales bacterium]